MCKIGVLISGRGTNLQALLNAQKNGKLGGEVVVVISNKSSAYGLERARKAGVKTVIVSKRDFPDRERFDKRLEEILHENGVELVVLAGYMRILTPQFIETFKNRIINIHPSLLPAFKGVNAQKQAIDYGVKVSGCTTHFVTADVDAGPIILQKAVEVMPQDDEESLAARILIEEHRLLVESVRLFCQGRLSVQGRRVFIKE